MKTPRRLTGFLLAAILAFTGATTAHSAGLRCQSDPVVLLSDGTVIDLSAWIETELWNVQSVTYVLRVPAGRYAVAVIRTPNWPTTIEKFSVVADQPPGRYDGTVTVRTVNTGTGVTATMLVGLKLASDSGHDRERLRVVIR